MLILSLLLSFASPAHADLSAQEKKIVEDAKKSQEQAAKSAPPSAHMQDKMQSTFTDTAPTAADTGKPGSHAKKPTKKTTHR